MTVFIFLPVDLIIVNPGKPMPLRQKKLSPMFPGAEFFK